MSRSTLTSKKKILFITTIEHRWIVEIKYNFSLYFDIDFYFDNGVSKSAQRFSLREGFLRLCEPYYAIFFHYEFAWDSLGAYYETLCHPRKIVMFYDDATFHDLNSQVLSKNPPSLVLTASPLSVLQYRSRGYECQFLPLEGSDRVYKTRHPNDPYRFDVYFSGSSIKDRDQYLEQLKRTNLRVPDAFGATLSYSDYSEALRMSKIVLNFSKSFSKNADLYIFKGRVLEAGFSGVLCLSEYFPDSELLFKNNELPMFRSAGEMIEKANFYINNPAEYLTETNRFVSACESYRPSAILDRLMHDCFM